MNSEANSDTKVDFPEGGRGLNALQVFVVFALVLSAALFGLRAIDALADPAAEVDRMYRDAAVVTDRLPVAKAAEGLPQLNDEARAALSAITDPVMLRDKAIIEDQVLDGLFVVEAGAAVVLRNVTLRGALVAESQLAGGQRGPSWVMLQDNVRIMPGDVLPGLAVMLPNGSLLADEDTAALQIQGDIVAQRVEILGKAALFGQILSEQPAVLSSAVEQFDLRHERAPSHEFALDASDLKTLTSFEFP
ncbi:MAG: hypothetical protein DHS20C15_26490 [Planctomycetota bacterium]|nr:MAG: hypothetical protein DHS20C15_26490 [Planctomycetota bacterium]